MFSEHERCLYRRNPLAEVICQLRFPRILSIGTALPVEFQEAIREEYPLYTSRQLPVSQRPADGGSPAPQGQGSASCYRFASADGIWRIDLSDTFLSLTCSRYTRWEEFAQRLDKPLTAFIKIYKPAFYSRVGLRYLNFVSRSALSLEEVPFRGLIDSKYLGPLAGESVREDTATRCSIDCDLSVGGGCRAKIHAGPGAVRKNGKADPELKFIFDLDLYMSGQLPVNLSAGVLQTLHAQAYPLFRGAITNTLHAAMEPEPI